jgi:hypothetical protein
MEKRMAAGQPKPATTQLASTSTAPRPATAAERMKQDRLPTASTPQAAAPTVETAQGKTSAVPVPEQNPLAYAAPAAPVSEAKKPFWKFWDKQ